MGADVTCDPCNPCTQCYGACCWPDGTCTMETTYDCCINGGDPDCGVECESLRCGLADAPSEPARGAEVKKTWGAIKGLYR